MELSSSGLGCKKKEKKKTGFDSIFLGVEKISNLIPHLYCLFILVSRENRIRV